MLRTMIVVPPPSSSAYVAGIMVLTLYVQTGGLISRVTERVFVESRSDVRNVIAKGISDLLFRIELHGILIESFRFPDSA